MLSEDCMRRTPSCSDMNYLDSTLHTEDSTLGVHVPQWIATGSRFVCVSVCICVPVFVCVCYHASTYIP